VRPYYTKGTRIWVNLTDPGRSALSASNDYDIRRATVVLHVAATWVDGASMVTVRLDDSLNETSWYSFRITPLNALELLAEVNK
jgi:hypothetical protein